MELSHEDSLRLNVLLTQDLQAIRIDESAMIVYALTSRGEAKVPLIANCKDDAYLRKVRELFSTHALGSPGGYPVYLKRWTRMRQTRADSLQSLLMLGEPEAIVAVANATDLSAELARCAWWALPTSDIARRLLENQIVAKAEIGKELAQYLYEFIPFESDAAAIVESVRLILQPQLISEQERLSLWAKAKRKSAFYVGFLLGLPDDLPEPKKAHPQWQTAQDYLAPHIADKNPYALQLCRLLSAPGQTYLATIISALNKISDQDVMVALLNGIDHYFHPIRQQLEIDNCPFTEIEHQVDDILINTGNKLLDEINESAIPFKTLLRAMLGLSLMSEQTVDPIFAQTDAVGSVMRKKLKPLTDPLLTRITQLGQS